MFGRATVAASVPEVDPRPRAGPHQVAGPETGRGALGWITFADADVSVEIFTWRVQLLLPSGVPGWVSSAGSVTVRGRIVCRDEKVEDEVAIMT